MFKKIFVLKGTGNCGKTSKINTIANWIIDNYKISNTVGLDKANLGVDTNGILTIGKLKIGINSAGDDLWQVKKIDALASEVDILICSCRTKGAGRAHIINNYNYSKGWLCKFISIEKYAATNTSAQASRDLLKVEELKAWLIGLEKL